MRLRRLQHEGRHDEALAASEQRLAALPENRDLLLIAAVSLRHLRRIPEALAMLQRLERLQPHFSRLHQERGLCFVQRKDARAAIEALLRAVNLNPALPNSWSMLEGLYRMTGAAADEWAAQGVPGSILLQKPFVPAQLVTALSQLLNTTSPPAPQV